MTVRPGPILLCCAAAAMLSAGCTQTVSGSAFRTPAGLDDDSLSPVDVETIMLDRAQMQAITGAGEDLTPIPGMDGKFPMDIEPFTATTPPQCAWIFAETQTFGADVEEFHKTTYQNPPAGGLISQGAAAYRDPATAHAAFTALLQQVAECDSITLGTMFVGNWAATDESVEIRTGGSCGRDYRLKYVVLVEVTFCSFPDSVADVMMTNILAAVPG